jgi:hypothetical protein
VLSGDIVKAEFDLAGACFDSGELIGNRAPSFLDAGTASLCLAPQ